ncbi:MAG TPA: hypothetical protein VFD56_07735, partial [Chitinophagaceae bacterium]|nr:hypothetical protein [Chitinophagaceae bacterium]
MREPTTIQFIIIVLCCLVFAVIGLYFLVNFGRLFRGSIRNEVLRKNAAAWIVIFFLSLAITPLGGGFSYMVRKFGWWGSALIEIIVSLVYTVVVYNTARAIAENKKLKSLSFVKHKLLILVALIATSMVVNVATVYILYGDEKEYATFLKYSVVSTIYLTATIGLVYAVINFLDLQRKRKFDEKELELTR